MSVPMLEEDHLPPLNFHPFHVVTFWKLHILIIFRSCIIYRHHYYEPLYCCFNTLLQVGILLKQLTSHIGNRAHHIWVITSGCCFNLQFQCFVANQVWTQTTCITSIACKHRCHMYFQQLTCFSQHVKQNLQ